MLDHAGDKCYYGVRIVTGSAEGAGADFTNEIYMKLVGSNGESGRVKLTDFVTTMEGSFRRKKYDDLVIESDKDLGEIQVVVVGNGHEFLSSPFSCWFVDFMIIHNFQSKTSEDFPCYHWIGVGDHVSFTAHTSKTLATRLKLMSLKYFRLLLGSCTKSTCSSLLHTIIHLALFQHVTMYITAIDRLHIVPMDAGIPKHRKI